MKVSSPMIVDLDIIASELATGDTFLVDGVAYMRIGGSLVDPAIPSGQLPAVFLTDGQVTMFAVGQTVQKVSFIAAS